MASIDEAQKGVRVEESQELCSSKLKISMRQFHSDKVTESHWRGTGRDC